MPLSNNHTQAIRDTGCATCNYAKLGGPPCYFHSRFGVGKVTTTRTAAIIRDTIRILEQELAASIDEELDEWPKA